MFKPKNPNHEKFEELCALAAIGQISANEFSELKNLIFLLEFDSKTIVFKEIKRYPKRIGFE